MGVKGLRNSQKRTEYWYESKMSFVWFSMTPIQHIIKYRNINYFVASKLTESVDFSEDPVIASQIWAVARNNYVLVWLLRCIEMRALGSVEDCVISIKYFYLRTIGRNAACDRISPSQNWVISKHHRSDIPQFSNLTSTLKSLRLKFN